MSTPELPLDSITERINKGDRLADNTLHAMVSECRAAQSLRDELAECRAKLAAQIERCGLAELAVAQRDIPLAAAQAENASLKAELSERCALMGWDLPACAKTPPGSRDALRKILRSAAVEAGRNCIETTEQLDALVARLLGEEGGQS